MQQNMRRKLVTLIIIALLATMATVLRQWQIVLPFTPGFPRLDASTVPVVIGGFILGPWAAIGIAYIMNFIALFSTTTMGVGSLADFIITCAYALPAVWIYRRYKTLKSAVIGLAVAIFTATIVAAFVNYFILLPFHVYLATGRDMDWLVSVFNRVNPRATSPFTVVLWTFTPFNLLQGIITAILSFALFFRLHNAEIIKRLFDDN